MCPTHAPCEHTVLYMTLSLPDICMHVDPLPENCEEACNESPGTCPTYKLMYRTRILEAQGIPYEVKYTVEVECD